MEELAKASKNTLREILDRAKESTPVREAEKGDITKLITFACACYGLDAPDEMKDRAIRFALQSAYTNITLVELQHALIWNMHGVFDSEVVPYRGMNADFILKVVGQWEQHKKKNIATNKGWPQQ